MELKSLAFEKGGSIPSKYTCDGDNVNPDLEICGVPENARSLVLIVDDPDAPAGTWVHWILFNISADTKVIGENSVPFGAVQGVNDFGNNNYGGPCPPSGTHRYFFKLYALDTMLEISENSKKEDVEGAMKGHVVSEAVLQGCYSRT